MTTKHTDHQDPEVVIEHAIDRTEGFIEKNSKTLLYIFGTIIVLAGVYLGYKYLYAAPRAAKAADTMFVAEQLFAQEKYEAALRGDGNNDGFQEIIDTYGSTPQGNLACHYAGICYIKMNKPDSALMMLERYKTSDGAPNALVNAQNFGLRGDILVNQEKYKEALSAYDKAIDASNNLFTTPSLLKKAGLVCEKLGDKAGAVKYYDRIRTDFGASLEARDIDKSIGRAEQ